MSQAQGMVEEEQVGGVKRMVSDGSYDGAEDDTGAKWERWSKGGHIKKSLRESV